MSSSQTEAFDLLIFDWAGTMVDFGCMAPISAMMALNATTGAIVGSVTWRKRCHAEAPSISAAS